MKKKSVCERTKTAFHRLVFLPSGEFSITRIFMVLTFGGALTLMILGVVLGAFYGITIPDNVYTYVLGLSGGGIVQYGLTKVVGAWGRNGTASAEEPVAGPEVPAEEPPVPEIKEGA